jgi:hypothetical protein
MMGLTGICRWPLLFTLPWRGRVADSSTAILAVPGRIVIAGQGGVCDAV